MSEHPSVDSIDNFSIGASTSFALPMWMQNCDFQDYDFVLLDFALNEEVWVKLGIAQLEHVEGCILSFMSTLGDNGPRPVIAILPSLSGHADVMPVRAMYRRIATENGYPLFDGYEFLQRHGHKLAIAPDGAFLDVDHMERDVGHAFGQEIAAGLAEIAARPTKKGKKAVKAGDYRYIYLNQCDITGGTVIDRVTSVISARPVRLEGGASVTVHLDEDVEMIGLGTNLSQANASVRISSGQGLSQRSGNTKNFSGGDDRLTYSIVPITTLRGRDFKVHLAPGQAPELVAEVIGLTALTGWSDATITTYS